MFRLHALFSWMLKFCGAVGLKSVRIHKTHRIHVWYICMGTCLSKHPLTQSAMQCTASVHTLHMPKPVITFVFKVLRNALLRYILYPFWMAAQKCDPAATVCCFTPIGGSTHVFQKKQLFFLHRHSSVLRFHWVLCNGISHGGEYVGGGNRLARGPIIYLISEVTKTFDPLRYALYTRWGYPFDAESGVATNIEWVRWVRCFLSHDDASHFWWFGGWFVDFLSLLKRLVSTAGFSQR